nr:uncharacterized protein LOC103446803 isoform X1 [Malus domestica]
MSYLAVGVSPGNVPVYHSTNLKVNDRRLRVAELVLRCLICGLGVVAAALVGTDTQVKEIFTVQKKAKFTDMKALVFLVVANGIVSAYSLVQVVRCVVSMVRGNVLFSKPIAWIIFSGDQREIHDAKGTIHSSSIALLQKRFREMQRVKAMREERDRSRMLAEPKHNKQLMMVDSNPTSMHYEQGRARLFFHHHHPDHHHLALPHDDHRSSSPSGRVCPFLWPLLMSKLEEDYYISRSINETPLLTNLLPSVTAENPNSLDSTTTSCSNQFEDSDCNSDVSDVDTSLHL